MKQTFSIVVNGVTVKKGVQESELGNTLEFYRELYPVQSITASPELITNRGGND